MRLAAHEHAAGAGAPRPPAPAASQHPARPTGPAWRPAPFSMCLHRTGTGQVLHLGDEPIIGALCGATAMLDEYARHGLSHWQGWPRCPECLSHKRIRHHEPSTVE